MIAYIITADILTLWLYFSILNVWNRHAAEYIWYRNTTGYYYTSYSLTYSAYNTLTLTVFPYYLVTPIRNSNVNLLSISITFLLLYRSHSYSAASLFQTLVPYGDDK